MRRKIEVHVSEGRPDGNNKAMPMQILDGPGALHERGCSHDMKGGGRKHYYDFWLRQMERVGRVTVSHYQAARLFTRLWECGSGRARRVRHWAAQRRRDVEMAFEHRLGVLAETGSAGEEHIKTRGC